MFIDCKSYRIYMQLGIGGLLNEIKNHAFLLYNCGSFWFWFAFAFYLQPMEVSLTHLML